MRLRTVLLITLGTLASAATAAVPTSFSESTFASGFSEITGLEWAPDGSQRLFVSQKGGQLRIVENGVTRTTPFATETVYTASECGLIGFAFDPDYVSNRFVYLFVTVSASEQQIVRYTDVSSVGQSRTVILRNLPTDGRNHDGGAIGFGPDGKLYFAIGDLGSGTGVNADLTSLAAKIGRANPDGSAPNDNPFHDGPGPHHDLIWARGHRNPFTFTFHPGTGALWVNTVGTNWEQVFVVSRGSHAGYNQYENHQPDGFLPPVIAYPTNRTVSSTITAAGRASGTATFETALPHGLRPGMKVVIAGVSNTSFNGTSFVQTVPSATRFTLDQPGSNATSGGGSATVASFGGCITGGVFYDATLFPLEYRGDFFFGDLNSGQLVHASLDATGAGVERVDTWATGWSQVVDVAVGHDGALYAAQFSGTIRRVSPTTPAQRLVVSRRNLRLSEGGGATFGLRLAQAPSADVSVSVALGGDTDVTASPASLTFTPANWAAPQVVTVRSAKDVDTTDDTANVTLSAAAFTATVVAVSVQDTDRSQLVLSRTQLRVAEGGTATFTVALDGTLTGTVTVTTSRTGGDTDVSVASGDSLTFTLSDHATPQTVTVAAADDADNVRDSATLTVSAPGAAARTVEVEVVDDEPAAPAFVTDPVVTAVAGTPYVYDADAIGTPPPTYAVNGPTGMAVETDTGLVTWTPVAAGTMNVTLTATNGVAPAAEQQFTVTVAVDQAPAAVLTRPLPGATLAGAGQEFFGDCVDDVGCPRGEFYVDDTLVFTDTAVGNHFHAGGTHGQFDTTAFADGAHVLRLRVFDSQGASAEATAAVTFANAAEEEPPASPGACGCTSGGGASTAAWLVGLALLAARRSRRRA